MPFKFFPDRRDPGVRVPYRYFLHYFTSAESLESTSVHTLYLDLLDSADKLLG
jgi:hypothetical protein